MTLRANFTVLFVRTSYVEKKTKNKKRILRPIFRAKLRSILRTAQKEFLGDTEKLELLITREVFVQSVHSSRLLVNFNQVIGRYWKQEV